MKKQKGKLRIFLGYEQGSRKDCTMLEEAHRDKARGVDLVVGTVASYEEAEVLKLLDGLEVLPPLRTTYEGNRYVELDLDGALKRKPELILVDQLEYTNVPGRRHKKRYREIEELRNAGIDVYTTADIQNVESLKDIVAAIEDKIPENTVPDHVFREADEIELVDKQPESSSPMKSLLMQYAMRRKRQGQIVKRALPGQGWDEESNQHILVYLNSSPENQKAIRGAARMAGLIHGRLTALHVEEQEYKMRPEEEQETLQKNIKLAEELGAHVAAVYRDDIPLQVAEFARINGVSKLVITRSKGKGFRKSIFGRPGFLERLLELAPDLEVLLVPVDDDYKRKEGKRGKSMISFSLKDMGKMIGILFLVTLISFLFFKFSFGEQSMITLFVLGVLVIANQTKGYLYGILASFLSVFLFDVFFMEPFFSIWSQQGSLMTLLLMLVLAVITSTLTSQAKSQADITANNLRRTDILFETSRKLQQTKTVDEIVVVMQQQTQKIFERPIVVYTISEGKIKKHYPYKEEIYLETAEENVVSWVAENNKPAGKGTETFYDAKAHYLPVVGSGHQVWAVAAVMLEENEQMQDYDKMLLASLFGQVALTLELCDAGKGQLHS